LRIRFWGVRGTIPTPGPDTIKVGGNTSCVDVYTSDQQLIIIDAGSGIRRLGQALQQENPGRIVGNILISHTHWDHIQGFPFFRPVFGRNNRFVLVGQKRVNKRLEEILAGQFIEPYLPFAYKTLPADLIVKEVENGETIIIGDNTTVQVADLNHPGGCLGFRIENNGVAFAYCSDVSHKDDGFDQNVLKLARGADLLVHDAHFATMEERSKFPDWGHSCWLEAAQVAVEANVGCLALFHYSPDLTDDELATILIKAREIFPRTILTREGLELNLPLGRQLPD
jgi:phosphoribosyl 1,2-cyclic phosphodiesterase